MEPKYKIGDKVQVVADTCGHGFPAGQIRVVTGWTEDNGEIRYNSAGDAGDRTGFYFLERDVTPIIPPIVIENL